MSFLKLNGHEPSHQPVYRNFHETVSVGEACFGVTVPRSYATLRLPNGETLHRRFKFTELNVTPGFYSQRALVLGVDGDGNMDQLEFPLYLPFAFGYTCLESLYFTERAGGAQLIESPFEQGNRALSLQDFARAANDHFQTLVPSGFARAPAFFDWVDLDWYSNDDDEQQQAHDSADQTVPLAVDPRTMVLFNSQEYYNIEEEEALGPFENGLPESVTKMTGVNNFLLPTTLETAAELLGRLRMRVHVAPNAAVSFSSKIQLENLGFTSAQVKGRGAKNRFHIENVGRGSDYLVFTAENPPKTDFAPSQGRLFCKAKNTAHIFDEDSVTFPVGSFSDNASVFAAVTDAMDRALLRSGLNFPKLRFDYFASKFRFEHPTVDRLSLFVRCDERLAERLGFGPVSKITQHMLASVMRDVNSTVEAETLCKALAFDTGMCIVTMDEASSNDTYGVDDFSMTTLWPTSSGTFKMSDNFSRSAFLPTVGGNGSKQHNLLEVAFTVSTLKKNSERIPLSWPVTFCVEGTLEGTV